jgi:hypothetical protein
MIQLNNIPNEQTFDEAVPCYSRLFLVVSFFCFITIFGSVIWFVRATNEKIQVFEKSISEKDVQIARHESEYEALFLEKSNLTQKYDNLGTETCDGEWSIDTGCVQMQALLTPLGGENFCIGSTTAITWDTAILSEGTVDIFLGNEEVSLRLGTASASEGSYEWDIQETYTSTTDTGARETITVTPGSMYSISLTPNEEGILGGQSDVFYLLNCKPSN